MPPKLCATNINGRVFSSFDIRASATSESRFFACWNTVAVDVSLRTKFRSTLYPHVHMRHLGRSFGRRSLGQNTSAPPFSTWFPVYVSNPSSRAIALRFRLGSRRSRREGLLEGSGTFLRVQVFCLWPPRPCTKYNTMQKVSKVYYRRTTTYVLCNWRASSSLIGAVQNLEASVPCHSVTYRYMWKGIEFLHSITSLSVKGKKEISSWLWSFRR
jgi:hypothetical protein